MLHRLILAAALTASAPTALAEDDPCIDPQDQATMNQCAAKSLEAAEAELNKTNKAIEARLKESPETLKAFTAVHAAWSAFVKADCEFNTIDLAGGSMQPMIYGACAETLTKERNANLQRLLACEEGDTGCPVPAAP